MPTLECDFSRTIKQAYFLGLQILYQCVCMCVCCVCVCMRVCMRVSEQTRVTGRKK